MATSTGAGKEADAAVAEALKQFAWVENVPISITVCDEHAVILAMNKRSRQVCGFPLCTTTEVRRHTYHHHANNRRSKRASKALLARTSWTATHRTHGQRFGARTKSAQEKKHNTRGPNKQIEEMMKTHETNAYTIEKAGVKKLIYQAPWYRADGAFGGLVELSMVLPADMPHFVRTPAPTA